MRRVRAFGKRELAEFRMRLETEHARLTAEIAAIATRARAAEEPALPVGDDESEDLSVTAGHSERERERALEVGVMSLLREVRAALDRIASGRYGVCARCDRRIPGARLRALPHATMCVRCKEYEERREERRQLTDRPEIRRILRARGK